MKKKNLISALLALTLLFGMVAGVLPVSAAADGLVVTVDNTTEKTSDEVKEIVNRAKTYNGNRVVDSETVIKTSEYDAKIAAYLTAEGLSAVGVGFDLSTLTGLEDAATNVFAGNPTLEKDTVIYVFVMGSEEITVKKTCDVSSAEALLNYEISKGYIDSAVGTKASLYVNRYTGMMYYVNEVTGQILTSNPYDLGYDSDTSSTGSMRSELLSQIHLTFNSVSDSSVNGNYYSTDWAAMYSQIAVAKMDNGLRVNYTLGDTATRFLLPGALPIDDFIEYILKPIMAAFENAMTEAGISYTPFDFAAEENRREVGDGTSGETVFDITSVVTYLNGIYDAQNKTKQNKIKDFYNSFRQLILTGYNTTLVPAEMDPENKDDAKNLKLFTALSKGVTVVPLNTQYLEDDGGAIAAKRKLSKILATYCPSYTWEMMDEHEAACGFNNVTVQKPSFSCSLEYVIDDNGDLLVSLPANSISFDESSYNLLSVSPLEYFGAGDMTTDGYVFYPDGSGAIVDFEDFYRTNKVNVSMSAPVYGQDYCYSSLTGAHRQQVTMPVYGLVSGTSANPATKAAAPTVGDTVTGGFFAIIEEGESLATLNVSSAGTSNKFMSAFASYTPYPSDKFDLSETISVSGLGEYTIVAKTKFTGSYVTRIKMLTDTAVLASVAAADEYEASYVGMAAYYRDYLKDAGVLSALETVSENIPLYVEVLGSMEITTKILSFPVQKKIALTSFEDIETIYEELRNCKENALAAAADYTTQAAAETDTDKKAELLRLADESNELAAKIVDITNVNFKLTGFTNGGMFSTYPTKVRWEKACGGKRGFKDLVATANEISAADGENFGIYPDFDFQYISHTSLFDGVSKRSASKMVDNRYASKQVYDSVGRYFETNHALVISADCLDKLFSKFLKKYSKYDLKTVSLSTLGSDLNSNFDEDNPINRDEAQTYVENLLNKITNGGYSIMAESGNMYAVKYATHLLGVSTDSSHYAFASYSVPFIGMILHGHVNYAGTALNYAGSPAYEMLRAIECGANPYYILCMQNASHMKDDEELSKYYSVDYKNWFESIVTTYSEMNAVLGELQTYELVGHELLLAERVPEASELAANLKLLEDEICDLLEAKIAADVDAKYDEMRQGGTLGKGINLTFDVAALLTKFAAALSLDSVTLQGEYDAATAMTADELAAADTFGAAVYRVMKTAIDTYSTATSTVSLVIDDVDIVSQYHFVTDSLSDDRENYDKTEYTCDNRKVVKVTYQKGTETVSYVLNYNVYAASVILENEAGDPVSYTLPMFGYAKVQ